MTKEIHVPHEIVNDDIVAIAQWNFTAGAQVESQDVVALVETSKAVVEVLAGAKGYLEIIHPQGAEVEIGTVIGRVGEKPFNGKYDESNVEDSNISAVPEGTSFSRKALNLIKEKGLAPDLFSGRGLVREKDVRAYLELNPSATEEIVTSEECFGSSDRTVSLEEDSGVGLLKDARIAAEDRGRSLLWLAYNYVWRTWLLSNLVRWSPRFAIVRLHRWRGVRVGSHCFIDPMAIIETAHPQNIIIGDDVRIAAQAVIMTHIKPPHYLRQQKLMAAKTAAVHLCDSCFIGVGAIIMPGVTVGKAAVVASGAVVVGDVPPQTMVAGNPAKVVKHLASTN